MIFVSRIVVAQSSRAHFLPGDAQEGMHAFPLGLGVEQAWPDHPHANNIPGDAQRGYLLKPNIQPMLETVDMISASRAYETVIWILGKLRQQALRQGP